MSVLIGLVDQRIQESETVGWDTNKIGGLPTWIHSESLPSIPECKNCGKVSSLVSQIYCPLGGSAYHRCIYLFVCPGVCSKLQNGWRVFRSMKHDNSYHPEINQAKTASVSKCLDELWTLEQDDWGEESGDWGKALDDWGEVACELVESSCDLRKTSGNTQQIQELTSNLTERDCVLACVENAGDQTPKPEVHHDVSDSDVSNSSLLQSVESLSQLMLSDNVVQYPGEGGDNFAVASSVQTAVVTASNDGCGDAEEPLVFDAIGLADAERWNAMAKLLNTKLEENSEPTRSKLKSNLIFESYYLSVVDEPFDQAEVCDHDHVSDLIRNYERSEGKQLHLLMSERPRSSKGREGPSELYEKTEMKHGDIIFYKFLKRLQKCPLQCIRYERGGDPLLVSSLQEQPVSRCSHCGGKRIFEFQLLPPLIPFLKAEDGTPCEVEFGTVLVFTCERNCWPADDDPGCKLDLLEESIILQGDPDIHLYR